MTGCLPAFVHIVCELERCFCPIGNALSVPLLHNGPIYAGSEWVVVSPSPWIFMWCGGVHVNEFRLFRGVDFVTCVFRFVFYDMTAWDSRLHRPCRLRQPDWHSFYG